jgi:hypothetical protein
MIDMHLMVILLAFNTSDTLTVCELREMTQIVDAELLRQLKLLIDAKILTTKVSHNVVGHLNFGII